MSIGQAIAAAVPRRQAHDMSRNEQALSLENWCAPENGARCRCRRRNPPARQPWEPLGRPIRNLLQSKCRASEFDFIRIATRVALATNLSDVAGTLMLVAEDSRLDPGTTAHFRRVRPLGSDLSGNPPKCQPPTRRLVPAQDREQSRDRCNPRRLQSVA